MKKNLTADQRFDKIDQQLERIAKTVIGGIASSDKKLDGTRKELRGHIDIYARAVDAYAKQAETYM